jgi:hypothetical protein
MCVVLVTRSEIALVGSIGNVLSSRSIATSMNG